ncbi:MAG: hypothetical protein IT289_05035 [Oligoflexia bacterium]|nr:hypothetical protein [Oligoflexia bacterium]
MTQRNRYVFWSLLIGLGLLGLMIVVATPDRIEQTPVAADIVVSQNNETLKSARIPAALKDEGIKAPLSVREIEKRFKTKVTIDRDTRGQPFRLSAKIPLDSFGPEAKTQVFSFIESVSLALGIDHVRQLADAKTQSGALGTIHNLQQEYEGLPVEGAQVRVHVNSRNEVFMVNSTYLPGLNEIPLNFVVSQKQAQDLAYQHARDLDPQKRAPNVSQPEKVIYEFVQTSRVAAAWKVRVEQPWLGSKHGVAHYFVSADQADPQNPSTFERVERALE